MMTARIAPAEPPFPSDIQIELDRVMRGRPALSLFATLARDPRLFHKFFSAGLLDKGHLTVRQREIVILRTTALCKAEYEWGVHVAVFAGKAAFSDVEIASLTEGHEMDSDWKASERILIRMCDSLHRDADLDDDIWQLLRQHFEENAVLELLMLAGFYRTVSYLVNALRLPIESNAARFSTTT